MKRKHSFRDKCVPKCNLGTRENSVERGSVRLKSGRAASDIKGKMEADTPAFIKRGKDQRRHVLLSQDRAALYTLFRAPRKKSGNRRQFTDPDGGCGYGDLR